MTGIVSNIQRFSIHDGPGIRTTIFFQGCPLRCWWCHNPECLDFDASTAASKRVKYTADQLIDEILKDRVFYEESNGGVTFSGGEPLSQPDFLKSMLHKCIENNIHTAIDTSGYANIQLLKNIKDHVNLFLYDLKLINDNEHIKYTGVSNKTILNNLQYLDSENKNIRIRIPLIPEITDTDENIKSILNFIANLKHKCDIDLLQYHKNAEGKYERMKMNYKLKGKNKDEKRTQEIIDIFKRNNFNVYI